MIKTKKSEMILIYLWSAKEGVVCPPHCKAIACDVLFRTTPSPAAWEGQGQHPDAVLKSAGRKKLDDEMRHVWYIAR